MRWLDGLDDAAFLAMDLERLGAGDLAKQFTRWYSEYSGDPAPQALRHHYVAYREVVRAKVACIRAGQGDLAAAGEARNLVATVPRHLRAGAATVVMVCGPPGTGNPIHGEPRPLVNASQALPSPSVTARAAPIAHETAPIADSEYRLME